MAGNVHSAEHWDDVLLPEIERQQQQGKDVVVRADAAFAKPELYRVLVMDWRGHGKSQASDRDFGYAEMLAMSLP